jgi:hypothetical protein
MKPKKANIVPGINLETTKPMIVDGYQFLSGKAKVCPENTLITVLTLPRKIERINLVKVELSPGITGEVFYCDILQNTKLI